MIDNRTSTHEMYTATDRHFCPHSEAYTGADSLLTAWRCGWKLARPIVYREEKWLRGRRYRTIYYFCLRLEHEVMVMPVLRNPFVVRLIRRNRLRVQPYAHLPSSDMVQSHTSTTAEQGRIRA